MSETITVNKDLSEEEIYKSLLPQIETLLNPDEPLVSNLANVTAALKDAFAKISWVGFYLFKDNILYLGPFQGKVACTTIRVGKGVCGTSAEKRQTIIVEDVEKFPGHIACDDGSKSEIVVPILKNDNLFGVLDIDSYQLSAFNEIDKKYLVLICSLLTVRLSFEKFVL